MDDQAEFSREEIETASGGTDLRAIINGLSDAMDSDKQAEAARQHPAAPFLVLADDSGLEVDALDGTPGIFSARYTPGSDSDRWRTLLAHLDGVPPERRSGRFRCVIAIVTPQGELQTVSGACEGMIATAPAGSGGFGYDPVFYLPELGCSMAELDAEAKNRISHRARAVQAALPLLQRLL
jgi:XTP/dITP diphosphohydrolase